MWGVAEQGRRLLSEEPADMTQRPLEMIFGCLEALDLESDGVALCQAKIAVCVDCQL